MSTFSHYLVPALTVLPFILLLGMIATGPVLYPHFWHRYYAFISPLLGLVVVCYYLFVQHDIAKPLHALIEYISFIALIGALYMASSGILIDIRCQASPLANLALLWTGAILSNVIGTTGASMLLIRPYMRINGKRIRPFHIVFFIFMVSNLGGALTPIGDPPLFLGFLKGVPFFWTLQHNLLPWLLALGLLSIVFYLIDRRNGSSLPSKKASQPTTSKGALLQIKGWINIVWLLLIVGAVFIDPNVFASVPSISFHTHKISFIREILLFLIASLSYFSTSKKILKANDFSFEPLKEVVCIFIGIFTTMIPALALISQFAQSPAGQKAINPHTLFWGTGLLSSVLDNAPTYLNFLAAGMASKGLSVDQAGQVLSYAKQATAHLKATSLAAVFFGAMTYVGNGPNFMVRAIAINKGIKMPSFGAYIVRYGLPFLLPILIIVWWIFFCC